MQKSGIEWTEFVSNPIKGQCLHKCPYCYAERIRQRFKQPEEMSCHLGELAKIELRKKPTTIFMGSMYDLFGAWVPRKWIMWILDTVKNCPQHTFIFLTKNPARYSEFEFPDNCWIGYSDDGTGTHACNWVYFQGKKNRFISFEPLRGAQLNVNPSFVDAIIIGAQSGPGAIKPKKIWPLALVGFAKEAGIPVFIKDNLLELFPDLPRLRETPWRRAHVMAAKRQGNY